MDDGGFPGAVGVTHRPPEAGARVGLRHGQEVDFVYAGDDGVGPPSGFHSVELVRVPRPVGDPPPVRFLPEPPGGLWWHIRIDRGRVLDPQHRRGQRRPVRLADVAPRERPLHAGVLPEDGVAERQHRLQDDGPGGGRERRGKGRAVHGRRVDARAVHDGFEDDVAVRDADRAEASGAHDRRRRRRGERRRPRHSRVDGGRRVDSRGVVHGSLRREQAGAGPRRGAAAPELGRP
mmetsp:Transcript_3191/g.9491  ORF Transcript_3191/g.9491 Transcript_3191/m.9491 type:complete len:234 (+) Transcript_3191:274-975(+)